jgi:IclR family transcriptional regulator, acetate operon repressor
MEHLPPKIGIAPFASMRLRPMINSVRKALDIVGLFTPSEPRLTLAEIGSRLGLPKSTAHNLLSTLLACGLVEKTDNDHYALGRAIIALTQAVLVNVELRDRAAPLLRELADYSRQSVYLTVRDGDYCLYIYAVESPRRLLARTAVGDRGDLHCTSVGKAILAYLPEEEVRSIIQRTGLPAPTSKTITDIDQLLADMELTRSRGYAIDDEEHELNTFCVGAPVLDENGQVIGSLSVSGADPDLLKGRLDDIAAHVMYSAQEVSRRMGYVPARPSRVAVAPPKPSLVEATR